MLIRPQYGEHILYATEGISALCDGGKKVIKSVDNEHMLIESAN